MMNWITKMVKGNPDEFAHAQLVKYGLGTHPGPRAELRFTSKKIWFKGDLGTEKIFLRAYLKGVPEGSQKVNGYIVTYEDRQEDFDQITAPLIFKEKSGKTATTYKASFKEVVPLSHLKELMEVDGPTTFFMLSIKPKSGEKAWKIDIKKRFPKGRKRTDDEKAPNFVKGSLKHLPELREHLIEQLFPEMKDEIPEDVGKIELDTDLVIEDIEIPKDPDMSFAEKRKTAKKSGKLIRTVTIDGEDYEFETEFYV